MPDNCNNKNPLPRSGTSQYQRVLNALLPEFARIDERDDADLILFTKKYAEYLNYYSTMNLVDGDWTVFMNLDISVVLATIAKQRPATYFSYISWVYNIINDYDKPGFVDKYGAAFNNDTAIKLQYKSLFDFLYTIIYGLDEHYSNLTAGFGFKDYLGNTIRSKMAEQVSRLRKYYDGSILAANAMIDSNSQIISAQSPIEVKPVQTLLVQPLTQLWNFTGAPFAPSFHGTTPISKIKNTVNHNIFKGVVENILKQVSAITDTAKPYLDETLTNFPKHSPHYALYLTFIKLFRYAQDDLNKFTGRHLDFYYKDILRLLPRDAHPDDVHLVFELAKNTQSHLVKKDTIFKAGKNAEGVELFYGLTDDIVLNKGVVQSVKSVTRKIVAAAEPFHHIFHAPVANSKDGKGEALGEGDAWKIFGDTGTNELAETGIAVAHSLLFLKEGERIIDLFIDYEGSLAELNNEELKTKFDLYYTGEKEWTKALLNEVKVTEATKKLHCKITIDDSLPACVPYDATLHGAGFETGLPILKLMLKKVQGTYNPALALSQVKIVRLQIDLDVKGVRDVTLQNDVALLDAAKAFEPFGPVPHIGSALIIGSNEIFLKNRHGQMDITMHVDWDKIDKLIYDPANGNANYPYFIDKRVRVGYLKDGQWKIDVSDPNQVQNIFVHDHEDAPDDQEYHCAIKQDISLRLPQFNNTHNFDPTRPYDIQSRSGFMKLEFRGPGDFGHGSYVARLLTATQNKTTPPEEPFAPAIKSFSLDYKISGFINLKLSASVTIKDEIGHFFHIHPFGPALQHKHFLGLNENTSAALPLFPVFNNEGEVFIGIGEFAASQTLAVLFQLSEGSANPNKERQDVRWYYLAANNIWKEFDKTQVVDNTNDLTKSGIVRFSFPSDATNVNTLMGEQLFWIRATIADDSDATCQAIALHAQAAVARLTDHGKTGVEYKSVLEAATISKLLLSDSKIKKISQPYASFNGKSKETNPEFYNHTSERLRHKKRPITIWDYERLVLQQFPQIYKVKCLNHTEVRIKAGTEDDNEIAPGHVVVVTIPDLTNLNAVNPLRPQTSLGTLEEIKLFLEQYMSPFVKLQVKNAKFEEIQLDFKVKFTGDDTSFYHDVLINELELYLSPWANGGKQNIDFGGRISKSILLNFIEERPYVDFVTCFKMNHIVDGVFHFDVEEAEATTARSVFVSYAGSNVQPKHRIEFDNIDCNCS
jgi:hypothetical protein